MRCVEVVKMDEEKEIFVEKEIPKTLDGWEKIAQEAYKGTYDGDTGGEIMIDFDSGLKANWLWHNEELIVVDVFKDETENMYIEDGSELLLSFFIHIHESDDGICYTESFVKLSEDEYQDTIEDVDSD